MIGAQSFKRHRNTEASSARRPRHSKAVATSQETTDDVVSTHRPKRQKRSTTLVEPEEPTKQRLPNELLYMIIPHAHTDSQPVLLLPKSMRRPTSEETRNFDPRFYTFKEETEPYNDEIEFHDDFEGASFDGSVDGSFVPRFSTPLLNLLLVSRLFRDEGYKAFYSNNSFSLIDYNHGPKLQRAIGDEANFIRHITVEQRRQPRMYFVDPVPPSSGRRLMIAYHEINDNDWNVYPNPADFPNMKSLSINAKFLPSRSTNSRGRGGLLVETKAREEFHLAPGDDPVARPEVERMVEQYVMQQVEDMCEESAHFAGLDMNMVDVAFTYDLVEDWF